jgi:hypothetical protein
MRSISGQTACRIEAGVLGLITARDVQEHHHVSRVHPRDVSRDADLRLIVADNGSDMYISRAMESRWNNDELNPAFHSLTAGDFEVVQLGWR